MIKVPSVACLARVCALCPTPLSCSHHCHQRAVASTPHNNRRSQPPLPADPVGGAREGRARRFLSSFLPGVQTGPPLAA